MLGLHTETRTISEARSLFRKCHSRREVSRRPPSQAQLQARIIEPPVYAELRDPAAVDEAAEADVRGLLLLVRQGVADVAPARSESHTGAHLVAHVQVEQGLGPEVLVVGRAGGAGILDRPMGCRPPGRA